MKVSKGIGRNATRCSLQTSAVLLIIFMLSGCSRRDTLPLVEESVSADQHLPFDATSDKTGISPTGSLAPAAIPAGTPVTIHLRLSLSSASSRAGDPFEAVLDEPIVVRGHTLAPRGAILSGRVLDAQAVRPISGTGLPTPGTDRDISQWQGHADPDFQHLHEAGLARATQCDHHPGWFGEQRRADRSLSRCSRNDLRYRQHGCRRRTRAASDFSAGTTLAAVN